MDVRGAAAWREFEDSPAVKALVENGFELTDIGGGDWLLRKGLTDDVDAFVHAYRLEMNQYVAPPKKMTEKVVLALGGGGQRAFLELRFKTVNQLLEALKGLEE